MTDRGRDCPFCAVDVSTAPPRERAHLTAHWRITAHRSALAGWMLLIPRRHIESLSELTVDEAGELGTLLRQSAAVQESEFGALKTYVMQFAEGVKHAHFSLVPRRADLPPDRVGAAVSAYNAKDEPLSEDHRDALAERMEAAWALL